MKAEEIIDKFLQGAYTTYENDGIRRINIPHTELCELVEDILDAELKEAQSDLKRSEDQRNDLKLDCFDYEGQLKEAENKIDKRDAYISKLQDEIVKLTTELKEARDLLKWIKKGIESTLCGETSDYYDTEALSRIDNWFNKQDKED